MLSSRPDLFRRALFLSWLLVALAPVLRLTAGSFQPPVSNIALWFAGAAGFGVLVWNSSRPRLTSADARPVALLAGQSAVAVGMAGALCTGSEGVLLVLVAAQLGYLAPLGTGLSWIVGQTAALGAVLGLHWAVPLAALWSIGYLGLQALAFLSTHAGAADARRRDELTRLNAELHATQGLLIDGGRAAERVEISRELHDVLGHHLAALSLQLEVAAHSSQGTGLHHVRRAQDLARLLLGDVRETVSAMRERDGVDVAAAVRRLSAEIPAPHIHVRAADDLRVGSPAAALTVVRCVQEIITNTIKHARAHNLWIDIEEGDGALIVTARDDGRGAVSVRSGLGLNGMRERLTELGGRLEIDGASARGFALRAWIPLPGGKEAS